MKRERVSPKDGINSNPSIHYSQRAKEEREAYNDMIGTIEKQLAGYSDITANGGSMLEDLRTWEAILSNKHFGANTMDVVRSSLQFQHSLNVTFGKLSTSLGTNKHQLEVYAKETKDFRGLKDSRENARLLQDSEDRILLTIEKYWKCYIEFFKNGYMLGMNIKKFFTKLHPEDPVFIEVPKAFGKDLIAIWDDDTDLRITTYILKYFDEYGSIEDSVFKSNVGADAVKCLIGVLEKGQIPTTGTTEAMAHVLLHWLGSLTEPVVPPAILKDALEIASGINNNPDMAVVNTKKDKMTLLINKLPKPNRIVLRVIIRGCTKIAKERSVGKLRYTQTFLEKIGELAEILGPVLTRCNFDQLNTSYSLVRYLILNAELFFPLGSDDEKSFVNETLKLGRVVRLTPEATTAPILPSPDPAASAGPNKMKIGDRTSSKYNNNRPPSPAPQQVSSPPPTYPLPPLPIAIVANSPHSSPNNSPPSNSNSPPSTTSVPSGSVAAAAATLAAKATSPASPRPLPRPPLTKSISTSSFPTLPTSDLLSLPSPSSQPSTPTFASQHPPFTPANHPPPLSPPTSPVHVTNNFITNNNITNNTVTNNITNIIVDPIIPRPPLAALKASGNITIPLPPSAPRTESKDQTDKVEVNQPSDDFFDDIAEVKSTLSSHSNSKYHTLGKIAPLDLSNPTSEMTGDTPAPPPTPIAAVEGAHGLLSNSHTPNARAMSSEIIDKIAEIRKIGGETEIFDQAFSRLLKLKIVIPHVEDIKTEMKLTSEVDKSELAKHRGDKLLRVRITIEIFSKEIIFVMETVNTIFSTSDVEPTTQKAVSDSLVKIMGLLSS